MDEIKREYALLTWYTRTDENPICKDCLVKNNYREKCHLGNTEGDGVEFKRCPSNIDNRAPKGE